MAQGDSRRLFIRSLAASGVTAGFAGTGLPHESEAAEPVPRGGGYINPRKVLLWECTRREIRERLDSGALKAALLPTGATEQHNEHMAMIMDTAASMTVSQLAALDLYPGAIVATPVPVGISPHWMDRKGTLTLRPETFIAVVKDI